LKLKARVKDDRLLGMLESSAGDAITLDLTVSEDGQSFKGEGDSWGKTIIYEAKKIDPTSKPDAVTKKMPETFDPKAPWTGTWKVDSTHHYDPTFWELKQSGNKISFNNVKGKAEASGNYLKGWYEGTIGPHRSFSIKIAEDSLSFKGKADMGSATIYLKGKRLGVITEQVVREKTVAVNPNEPWTGTWKVTGPETGDLVLNLKQSGNKIKSIRGSTYNFRGKVKGNRLKGWYVGRGVHIIVDLKISQDAMSFKGKESFYGKTYKLKGERQK
jgi:hypothetical protein